MQAVSIPSIDLVADIGESFGAYTMGDDARILRTITSANVACGFHAGDPQVMDQAVRRCIEAGVEIGAHPSFPDLVGFGRRAMDLTRDEVRTDVLYQVGALGAFARAHRRSLAHVSPHGRLGNLVVADKEYAGAVAEAVEAYDPTLPILTQPGELELAARDRGLRVGILAMIDRAYEADGSLVSRRLPGAVLHDPEEIADRAVRLVVEKVVIARTGERVEVEADSLLMHGDNDPSIRAAELVRRRLEAEGVRVAAFNPSGT